MLPVVLQHQVGHRAAWAQLHPACAMVSGGPCLSPSTTRAMLNQAHSTQVTAMLNQAHSTQVMDMKNKFYFFRIIINLAETSSKGCATECARLLCATATYGGILSRRTATGVIASTHMMVPLRFRSCLRTYRVPKDRWILQSSLSPTT